MKYPFEASFSELQTNLDAFVDVVFSDLTSNFLVMPKGPGFISYSVFEAGYEALKQVTGGFREITPGNVSNAARRAPVAIIVLRAILGFTPSEWAYLALERTGVQVTQGFVRSLDRAIRLAPTKSLTFKPESLTGKRIKALIESACQLIVEGAPTVADEMIHRLDKADTRNGPDGIRALAELGAPYAMLLYERFLGRPFAGHRDSVSELVGDVLESAIEDVMHKAGITYRKTKRAERIEGFDQAPDFIVPSEFNPQAVIEAKITEDDGTARDKVTRIQHLAELSARRQSQGENAFEVVACLAGRGFGVRREDMKKVLLATRGKVFTFATLPRLTESTRLSEFRTRR